MNVFCAAAGAVSASTAGKSSMATDLPIGLVERAGLWSGREVTAYHPEDLRKRCRAPLAHGLCSAKALLSLVEPLVLLNVGTLTAVDADPNGIRSAGSGRAQWQCVGKSGGQSGTTKSSCFLHHLTHPGMLSCGTPGTPFVLSRHDGRVNPPHPCLPTRI